MLHSLGSELRPGDHADPASRLRTHGAVPQDLRQRGRLPPAQHGHQPAGGHGRAGPLGGDRAELPGQEADSAHRLLRGTPQRIAVDSSDTNHYQISLIII